jgi:ATP-dependent Lon protease
MAEPVRTYPSEFPVVALRQLVVFPLTLQPLAVNRPASMESVNRALATDRMLFLALQTSDAQDDAEPDDVRKVGTIAAVRQMARAPNGGLHIIVEGLTRAKAETVTKSGSSLRATVNPIPEPVERTLEVDAYVRRLQELVERGLSIAAGLSQDLRGMVAGIDEPLRLVYLLSNLLDMKAEDKQHILEADNLITKLQAVTVALSREISLLIKSKIESETQEEMTDAQRQYYLRQQLKTIQEELGEGEQTDAAEVRKKILEAKLPDAVALVAEREVERLERMTPA